MSTQTQSHTYLPPRADARDDLLAVAAQLYAAQRHAGGATPYRLCGPEGTSSYHARCTKRSARSHMRCLRGKQ